MTDKIAAALRQIEQEHGCRILFAAESGSRAWGFASPDSDYDIRAVYVKPLDWYLQLGEPPSDTISAMLPDDLDVVAWDLRKFLQHMCRSNASVLEWLGSPIVYKDVGILETLKSQLDECIEPSRIAFHYASMFKHAMDDRREDGSIRVKKICYALRASLCVRWVLEKGTMPPTSFQDVRNGLDFAAAEAEAIDRLLALKSGVAESERLVPEGVLVMLLHDWLDELQNMKWTKQRSGNVEGRLTEVFQTYAKNF